MITFTQQQLEMHKAFQAIIKKQNSPVTYGEFLFEFMHSPEWLEVSGAIRDLKVRRVTQQFKQEIYSSIRF